MTASRPPVGKSALVWWTGGLIATSLFVKVWTFNVGAFDLGFFVHALRTTADRGPFADVPMLGFSFLEDHFSPLALPLALLAPLSFAPYLLPIIQTGFVSVAARTYLIRAHNDGVYRPLLVTAGFLLAPTIAFAAWNDFHPSLLAAPFLLRFFLYIGERDERTALWSGAVACLAREDIALVVLVGILFWPKWVRPRLALAVLASGCMAISAVLGKSEGIVGATGYIWESQTPLSALASEVWDGGAMLRVMAVALLPFVIFARIRLRFLLAAATAMLPVFALDVDHLDWVRDHYYFPAGIILAAGVLRSPAWNLSDPVRAGGLAVLLAWFIGPFGFSIAAPSTPSALATAAAGWERREELANLHGWLASRKPSGTASLVTILVPFDRTGDAILVWPSPFQSVVLPGISDRPLIRAGDTTGVRAVVAPSTVSPYGPTGEDVDLAARGFVKVEVSPDGALTLWQRVDPSALLAVHPGCHGCPSHG